jgi:hypothetical protein
MRTNSKICFRTLRQVWLLVSFTLLCAAIPGGCTGDISLGGDGGGISGSGVQTVATGSVTGFGSVIVGGVHYAAKPGATVQVDGIPAATEADLQPGMVVVVHGSFDSSSNTGTYDSIRYRADLEGPVAGVDLLAGVFTVFGQTVLVDAATVFDGLADFAALPNGTLVQVSGSADPQGRLHAIRVFRVQGAVGPTDTVKIKGRVSGVATGSFAIGSQSVAFIPGQTVFDNLSASDLSAADSRLIEVTGTLSGTTVNATRIERLDSLAGAVAGVRVYLRGFVVSGNATSFLVNTPNGPVTVAGGSASFESGTPAAIQTGLEVGVTGSLSGAVLQASVVQIERDNNISLEGDVGSLALASRSLTINGVTVAITDQTLFKDSSAAKVRGLNLSGLVPGDHIRIGGNLDRSVTPARVIATKLERFNPSNLSIIQGPVSQLFPQLIILGVPITVSAGTDYLQGGVGLGSLSAFNAQVSLNSTVVKAKGSFARSPAQLLATELEIKQ